MARRAGSVFTVLVIIWLSELPGIQMSVNLKDQLILSSTTASNPNYPVSGTTDGNYGPLAWYICMSSDPANPVFWRGTFTGLARIQRIDIEFISPGRADGYQFWISNGTDVPSGIKCYEDADVGYPNITQNITSCNITGKTLMIYITRTSGNAHMDVCEVDVYGCFSNKYGDQCENNCNCKHGCDPDSGVCDSPYCNAGWSGSRFCDQPCSQVTFGENCLKRCHCKTPGCNSQNGVCLIQGCQAGYSGASCSQECAVPYFGNNCASQCRCRTHGCNHIDGTCTVPGCQIGWIGPSCSTQCQPGYFGANCSKRCHCKDAGCSHVTGNCSSSGCLPGWRGNTCSESCGTGSFGETCSLACAVTCKDFVCHHETGHCFECYPGKYGVVCGADCPSTCRDNICNKDDGHCLTTGCGTGSFGETCSLACPVTCKDFVCHHETGHCLECYPGKYGVVCGADCSDTCTDNICNKDDGHCLSTADSNLTIIAALSAVCGLLLAALIALTVVICFLRKRPNRNKSSDKETEQSVPDTGYTSITPRPEETPNVYEMVVT